MTSARLRATAEASCRTVNLRERDAVGNDRLAENHAAFDNHLIGIDPDGQLVGIGHDPVDC